MPPTAPENAPCRNRPENSSALEAAATPLDPGFDNAAATYDFFANAPGFAIVDNLVSPAALERFRNFFAQPVIWQDPTNQESHHLLDLLNDVECPLALQLAQSLRQMLPEIFGDRPLRTITAERSGNQSQSGPIQTDKAAVKVVFWMTPQEANRDPYSGGIVIYSQPAPPGWDIACEQRLARHLLADPDIDTWFVDYRQNRAVIFDATLFHEDDSIDFEDGDENRRVAITMLFGEAAQKGPTQTPALKFPNRQRR